MTEAQKKIEQICRFRAALWLEFHRDYQKALAFGAENFSLYCEEFRARWIAGR